ncbi:MAG: GNAT family N-acetyltransferase [Chloroflexia bacterium]|nr:GNAT family N-acetyltransferase [Chloroflexia bacterium]
MPTSSPRLTTYDSAVAFRHRAEPFLLRHEAANNLMLGLIDTLIATPRHYPLPPYLATVDDGGEVVAAFMRTPPYNLLLSTSEVPAALDLVAAGLAKAGATLPGVTGPTRLSRRFGELWQQRTVLQAGVGLSLRIFALRQVKPVPVTPGRLRRTTRLDRESIIAWYTAFAVEADLHADRERIVHGADTRLDSEQGGFWFWEVAGEPVTLAGATGPTPHGIRIGPVYTPPEHRRHGYATAATAALSQLMLDAGRAFCFLYTDRANPTSNHIYQAIGYEAVRDVDDVEFHEEWPDSRGPAPLPPAQTASIG